MVATSNHTGEHMDWGIALLITGIVMIATGAAGIGYWFGATR